MSIENMKDQQLKEKIQHMAVDNFHAQNINRTLAAFFINPSSKQLQGVAREMLRLDQG
jgi:hypothetical protein